MNISLGKLQNLDDKIGGQHVAGLVRQHPKFMVSRRQYDCAVIYFLALGSPILSGMHPLLLHATNSWDESLS
jgi:hypothetical protein